MQLYAGDSFFLGGGGNQIYKCNVEISNVHTMEGYVLSDLNYAIIKDCDSLYHLKIRIRILLFLATVISDVGKCT